MHICFGCAYKFRVVEKAIETKRDEWKIVMRLTVISKRQKVFEDLNITDMPIKRLFYK